jgi:hypothetical protein
MESTTSRGALESLGCFVHGDATDTQMTTRFVREAVSDIYRQSPSPGIGSRIRRSRFNRLGYLHSCM